MLRDFGYLTFIASILWGTATTVSMAADATPQALAEQPFSTIFVASIQRVFEACATIFETADRPDLARTFFDRFAGRRDFAGIDRSKPLGVMSVWDQTTSSEIVFAPVSNLPDFLTTATFGIVGFHEVDASHYEIERPGSPYHVIVRKDYAFLGDSVPKIRAIRVTPERLTRGLRDRYDVGLNLDLRQIPLGVKTVAIANLRSQTEPWLQPQDSEPTESANLRKTLGQMILDLAERTLMDTRSVNLGARLNPETRQLNLEAVVEAVPKSPMAVSLNRLSSFRSEFAPLLDPDVPAGVALNLPISGLADKILGTEADPSDRGSHLEAAIQLAGTGLGDLSLIIALNGPDAEKLNDAIPRLLVKLEESGQFTDIEENFDLHQGVVLHSLTPKELPTSITQWIGNEVEMIIGQDRKTVWLGMGHPQPLLDRLLDAIDLVHEPENTPSKGPLFRARFQARKLPSLVASDLLVPDADVEVAREAFSKGNDGFNLVIEPITDGIKLRIEFEEGFTRLIGENWIRQIESPNNN